MKLTFLAVALGRAKSLFYPHRLVRNQIFIVIARQGPIPKLWRSVFHGASAKSIISSTVSFLIFDFAICKQKAYQIC